MRAQKQRQQSPIPAPRAREFSQNHSLAGRRWKLAAFVVCVAFWAFVGWLIFS